MNKDERYITVEDYEKKNAFIYRDVKRDIETVNKRIDKYADKTDCLQEDIAAIKVTMQKILSHQENEEKNITRLIEMNTKRLDEMMQDVKANRTKLNLLSGGLAVIAFLFSYLWSIIKN